MLGQLSILSFKQFEARLKTFVSSHNNLNTNLSTKIRISRKSALRNIVNYYRNFVTDYKNNANWQDAEMIPEMPMRRKTLALAVGCCEKTAYNHLKFLVEAGVLIKKLHGRQNDFGVFLNPYFWLLECENLPNWVMKKATTPPDFALSLVHFLPPISVQEFQESNNYYKKDVETVDKVVWETTETASPQFQRIESDNFSRKSIEQMGKSAKSTTKALEILQEGSQGGAGELSTQWGGIVATAIKEIEDKSNGTNTVGGNESVRTSEVPPQLPSDNELEAWTLVKKFTDYAFSSIYQSNEFNKNFFVSQSQYAEIKNLVMSDVFGNFQNATEDVWRIRQAYTDGILAIDKAVMYARKHKWSSFLHPKCYFSKSFQKSGKRGTFFEVSDWHKENKKQLNDLKKQELLEKAKHHVAFAKPPRGRKDLTSKLQISNYFKTMIAKRCGAFHVSLFNQFLANPQNF